MYVKSTTNVHITYICLKHGRLKLGPASMLKVTIAKILVSLINERVDVYIIGHFEPLKKSLSKLRM